MLAAGRQWNSQEYWLALNTMPLLSLKSPVGSVVKLLNVLISGKSADWQDMRQ